MRSNLSVVLAALLLFSCCFLPAQTQEKNYTNTINQLKASIEDQTGIFYHSAYERLAYLSDTYGPRLWGSDALESVIL